MMVDLSAIELQVFLDDRITDDEVEANHQQINNDSRDRFDYCTECRGDSSGLVESFDPERALAEARIKRHMIDEALIHGEGWRNHISRYLALAYRDHAGYRDEWMP